MPKAYPNSHCAGRCALLIGAYRTSAREQYPVSTVATGPAAIASVAINATHALTGHRSKQLPHQRDYQYVQRSQACSADLASGPKPGLSREVMIRAKQTVKSLVPSRSMHPAMLYKFTLNCPPRLPTWRLLSVNAVAPMRSRRHGEPAALQLDVFAWKYFRAASSASCTFETSVPTPCAPSGLPPACET